MAWYKEWFGEEYLELYAHRNLEEAERHIDFVESRLGWPLSAGSKPSRPQAVLDLACGAGRHTETLRKRGYRALGVDLSITLLALRPDLPRVSGDMRCLPFVDGSFDWILNFFTSFGYFEQEEENFQVLDEIYRLLRPGGRFLIDLMNPQPVIENLRPGETFKSKGRQVDIKRWYDQATRRVNKRIRVTDPGGTQRSYLESVRAYSEPEVSVGLARAGLEVVHRFGSFDADPYRSDSQRLIFVGARPG